MNPTTVQLRAPPGIPTMWDRLPNEEIPHCVRNDILVICWVEGGWKMSLVAKVGEHFIEQGRRIQLIDYEFISTTSACMRWQTGRCETNSIKITFRSRLSVKKFPIPDLLSDTMAKIVYFCTREATNNF